MGALTASLAAAAAAFCLTYGANRFLMTRGRALLAIDRPNERSLHATPVPRGGGLGIAAALLAVGGAALAWAGGGSALGQLGPLAGAGLAVAIVSYWDDHRPLRPAVRLLVQCGAAMVGVAALGPLQVLVLPGGALSLPIWLGAVLTVIFIVWMTNLYNFMDGMDGFAAGMTVIGFLALAGLGWQGGDALFCAASLTVAAAGGGFLALNFPPARLFMGDVGASLLGFLAAGFLLWGQLDGLFPLWAGVLAFSPFIVDATVTLLRRAFAGERVWTAHRSHFYQRLVRLGWGHRRTVLAEYGLMLACGAAALLAVRLGPVGQWSVIAASAAVFLALMHGVRRLEAGSAARARGSGRRPGGEQ